MHQFQLGFKQRDAKILTGPMTMRKRSPSRFHIVYKLLSLLAILLMLLLMWDFSPTVKLWDQTESLLGILLVGKSDVYTIQDWLHRHINLFEKLVVIDGSENEWVRELLESYEKGATSSIIHHLSEASLNLSIVNDQSLRAPAMSVLGDPVGRWIMICHADEFWVMDPRHLIDLSIKKDPKVNLLRVGNLWASPLESTYQKTVQLLDDEPALLYNGSFHIQQVCNKVHHRDAPSGYMKGENRIFQWQKGMHWGTHRHSLVVPEFINAKSNYENYVKSHIGFYIHFKMHDFAKTAMIDGFRFANSKLMTGVHNDSATEGWMGQFLDLSFPDALKKYPPRPLDKAIEEECQAPQFRSMCSLPWNLDAKFNSARDRLD